MSNSRTMGANARLLPSAVEHSLHQWTWRTLGCLLVGVAVSTWIAVLSWTVSDPSLTHTTAMPVRNLLGPVGAAGSDLVIQTLGLSVVFVIIGPMVWGLELLAGAAPMRRFGIKILAYMLSVLALAGALSGIPTMQLWPLHNGFGGMLGDIIYNMSSQAVSNVNADLGGSLIGSGAGGFALLTVGLGLLLYSLGVRLEHADAFAPGLKLGARLRRLTPRPTTGPSARPRSADADAPTLSMPANVPAAAPFSEATVASAFEAETEAKASSVAERFAPAVKPVVKSATPARSAAAAGSAARSTPPPGPGDLPRFVSAAVAATRSAGVPPGDVSPFGHEPDGHAWSDGIPHPVPQPMPAPMQQSMPRPMSVPMQVHPLAAGSALADAAWQRPGLELLAGAGAQAPGGAVMADADAKAGLLIDVLADFGVEGTICDIKPGPVVTRYEFEPARGVKTARVIGLADDIARSLGAISVRIAVVPGRNAIGVEVPNAARHPVLLGDILASSAFRSSQARLPLALGRGIGGEPVVVDLAHMPHLLIAGTTGSGKSVGINTMILSLIYRLDPSRCRLVLIDPKMLELAAYNAVPHLSMPVVTDPQTAVGALEALVGEMEDRYQRMAKLGVRNIEGFNARAHAKREAGQSLVRTVQTGFDPSSGQPVFEHQAIDGEPMPYIVVVVDEFADLILTAGARLEAAVQRLAQMARAAGIHLIMATQRPSVDVVTGTIKANFPCRISFRVASRTDSRTILGEAGAEQLLGQGDMLVALGPNPPQRVHGAFVSDEEVARVVGAFGSERTRQDGPGSPMPPEPLRPQGPPPGPHQARPAPMHEPEPPMRQAHRSRPAPRPSSLDDAYEDAVSVVVADRKVSPGHLHRRLGLTEAMAAELIERMEQEGLVGALDRFGRRKILVPAPTPSPPRQVA